jgi:hypothetical protein
MTADGRREILSYLDGETGYPPLPGSADLVNTAELVDLAIIRLVSIAAQIECEVRAGNPAFRTHQEEKHAWGYRRAAQFVIKNRDSLL